VVTLDLVMPNLDGLGVLHALAGRPRAPRVIVVSISDADTALGVEALAHGAFELVHKPSALPTARLYDLGKELVEKVTEAGRPGPKEAPPEPASVPASAPLVATTTRLVVVGTSTGGPQALTRLLAALPPGLPVPIVMALHIPAGYTESLARRLDAHGPLNVVEVSRPVELRPGLAALAAGGTNVVVEADGGTLVARPSRDTAGCVYVPSVDRLFESAARAVGAGTLGVVLTGMGDDGLAGARAIHAAGGRVLAESAFSCIVDGMPRVVREAGLAAGEASLAGMPALILRHL
jgi:two-component system chemotaxis response regulator CheB